jgi:hypothetical protein
MEMQLGIEMTVFFFWEEWKVVGKIVRFRDGTSMTSSFGRLDNCEKSFRKKNCITKSVCFLGESKDKNGTISSP